MKGKHIGIYIDQKPTDGGGYQYIEFVLDALRDMHELYMVKILCVNDGWGEFIKEKYDTFSCERVASSSYRVEEIIKNVNSSGCDYLIVPFSSAGAWIASEFNIPFVAVIHDVMQFYDKHYEMDGYTYTSERIIHVHARNCRRAIGVLVDSDLGKKQLLHVCGHLYKNKIYIQPFRVPGYLSTTVEEKPLKLQSDKFIFYPAQVWAAKNHVSILLALEELNEQGISVNVVFTGASKDGNAFLKRISHKLGLEKQVEFLGYVGDAQMKWLYSHARAMVMPSFSGPTNIPHLEAMYTGCPAIVSNEWAAKEQMGAAALYVNPKYSWDVANAIKKVWLDDGVYQDLVSRGKEQVKKYSKKKFNCLFAKNLDQILGKYEDGYDELRRIISLCMKKKTYIYGGGKYARLLSRFCFENKLTIEGVIVSDKDDNPDSLYGYRVYGVKEIVPQKNTMVLLGVPHQYYEAVIKSLHHSGICVENCTDISNKTLDFLVDRYMSL